jgi:hypothetical protein
VLLPHWLAKILLSTATVILAGGFLFSLSADFISDPPGIWWIRYYGGGKRHREKVGRKSDAIKLYQSRKADAVGRKLPELRNSKVVTLSELIDNVLESVAHHRDNRSYESKGEIVRKALS